MITDIIITVQGPEHSGKKHVIAAMKKSLAQYGMDISVIGGDAHLNGKQLLSDEELSQKLSTVKALVIDQTTGPAIKKEE